MRFTVSQITFEEYPAAKRDLDAALAAGDALLDFSSVSRVDSTAVALLLHAERQAKALGLTLVCQHLPESYGELVALYGLESLLSNTLPHEGNPSL